MPAYLSADIPGGFEQVARESDAMYSRVKQFSASYDETMAQELVNAAANWPWVNPQLTATLVLTGNSHLMEPVAAEVATQMMRAGLDWGERRKLKRYYDRESTRNAVEWTDWYDG